MISRLALSFAGLIFILASQSSSADVATASATKPSQRVLVIYSDERLLPANVIIDEAIRTTFSAQNDRQAEFHSEFLDRARFPSEAQEQRERDFLRNKYQDRMPELVIAVSGFAVDLLVKYRADLFRDVPIVFCSVAGDTRPAQPLDERIAEVSVFRGEAPTLEMALRLQPKTRNVAVVVGSGVRDKSFADAFRKEMSTFENRVTFRWLTDLSVEQLRGELSRLPEHTIVLYLVMFQDVTGQTFTPRQALDRFAPTSAAPIYGCYDTYLGHGIVGGTMVTFEQIGRKAAQLGMRILAGEDPQTVARTEMHQPVPMFDWLQLHRWKIREKLLPPGSIVRSRELNLWERYRGTILAVAALCVLETLLIAYLLWQRTHRRLAEASLRESDQRMMLAVQAGNCGVWVRDIARNEIWASEEWRAFFGFEKAERLELAAILERVHPEDRDQFHGAIATAVDRGGEYDADYRIVLPDGGLRWMTSHGRAECDGEGKPLRMRGVSRDITARKVAELEAHQRRNEVAHLARVTTLGEISGSLAHELNQPLAAILANTEAAEAHLQHATPDLEELRSILADIRKDDVRASETIQSMRAFLRRQELKLQPLEVGQLAHEVVKLIAPDAAHRKTSVGVKIQEGLPRAVGDRIHLQQVLLNLLINAMDAMSTVPIVNRCVTVHAKRIDAKQLEVAVRDAGIGLSPQDSDKAFEPFHTTKKDGLGLGLAICRSIIEAHGGSISLSNNPDRGSTSRFTLPVFEEGMAQ